MLGTIHHVSVQQSDIDELRTRMPTMPAHPGDTIGAQSVGCSGALIARPGNAPLSVPGLPQPQAVAPDLPGVATQLIKLLR